MSVHKDQDRFGKVALPAFHRVAETEGDAVAERDATVMNRMFVQGADPLFLMEAAPSIFSRLCADLDLAEDVARSAVEKAHCMGPGSLLNGGAGWDGQVGHGPESERCEILWLILASCSSLDENPYADDVSMTARLVDSVDFILKLNEVAFGAASVHGHFGDLVRLAADTLAEFVENTEFTPDPRFGLPQANEDWGFYVGYKQGHPCVAVESGGLTFYGTTNATTLAAEGVTVDKELSPHFGICFGGE
jgi:hypothetical protein